MDEDQDLNQGEEVKGAESDTAAESSDSEETVQASEDTSSADESGETEEKTVPYSRFKEINEQKRQAEAKVAEYESKSTETSTESEESDPQQAVIKKTLNEMGFVSRDQLEQIRRQDKEDDALRQEMSRLSTKYDGKDGRPKFDQDAVVKFALDRQIGDLETAYEKLNQAKIIDWHVKQALDKSGGVKTEASDGSGSGEAGPTNQDLLAAYDKGDKGAIRTLLKRVARSAEK